MKNPGTAARWQRFLVKGREICIDHCKSLFNIISPLYVYLFSVQFFIHIACLIVFTFHRISRSFSYSIRNSQLRNSQFSLIIDSPTYVSFYIDLHVCIGITFVSIYLFFFTLVFDCAIQGEKSVAAKLGQTFSRNRCMYTRWYITPVSV